MRGGNIHCSPYPEISHYYSANCIGSCKVQLFLSKLWRQSNYRHYYYGTVNIEQSSFLFLW